MDRQLLVEHLDQAERHVAEGERHIARQRDRVAELQRDGHDSALAVDLLHTFEATQAEHLAGRDRIRAELANGRE